ncbi:DoxX family protein [Propioniciclava coleopterorum]|uniref:DoxX family protein n=1 Tax=Propioniciclava coleopterorum TaxID=2714937 RepID=A0A6G7Y4I9_9ACTN|nr:DoxX family protein [Propioniciclava coleopterorum]QIK71703.1 DoxX family protein [Propioniciclava coleopterorum]
MIVALWILNALLALAFLGAGLMKLATPKATLREKGMAWTDEYSATMVKVIGGAEALGALGLILPLATGIAPILAPIAALCLALTMAGAVATHVRRKEPVAPGLVLGLASLASAALGFAVVL